MEMRGFGLVLLWVGTILLVAVLQHRIRKGAWSAEAFEQAPPIERWSARIATVGIGLALSGAAVTVWGYL